MASLSSLSPLLSLLGWLGVNTESLIQNRIANACNCMISSLLSLSLNPLVYLLYVGKCGLVHLYTNSLKYLPSLWTDVPPPPNTNHRTPLPDLLHNYPSRIRLAAVARSLLQLPRQIGRVPVHYHTLAACVLVRAVYSNPETVCGETETAAVVHGVDGDGQCAQGRVCGICC